MFLSAGASRVKIVLSAVVVVLFKIYLFLLVVRLSICSTPALVAVFD